MKKFYRGVYMCEGETLYRWVYVDRLGSCWLPPRVSRSVSLDRGRGSREFFPFKKSLRCLASSSCLFLILLLLS